MAAASLIGLDSSCGPAPVDRVSVAAGRAAAPPSPCAEQTVVPESPGLLAIRARVRLAVAADSAVSVSIAAVAGRELLWAEAFGTADRERGIEALSGTPYAVASVTKPVTAAAVLRLAERGAIDLDRPVNAYLEDARLRGPAGTDWAERVSVRDLLRHRGGLPTHFHFIHADEQYERPSMDETIRRYGIVVRPPGEHSVYSNLGYGILERLVEIADGRDYATFVEEEIFRPLGIDDAWVGRPPDTACPPAANYAFSGPRLPRLDFDHRGASAVVATARAMARFGAAHFDRLERRAEGGTAAAAVLGAKTRRAVRVDTVVDPDGRSRGLGWNVRRHYTGHVLIEHSGGMPGTISMLRVAPEAGVSVFAVSNGETSGLPGDISAVTLDTLLAAAPAPTAPRDLEGRPAKQGPTEDRPTTEQDADLAGRWCGTLETWQDRHQIELHAAPAADASWILWPGRTDSVAVANLTVEGGRVSGRIEALIPTPDAVRSDHYSLLEAFLHEGVVTGAAIAMAVPPTAERVRYGLASRIWLTRDCAAVE